MMRVRVTDGDGMTLYDVTLDEHGHWNAWNPPGSLVLAQGTVPIGLPLLMIAETLTSMNHAFRAW